MIPSRITTVTPHSASTPGLRNQGDDVSAEANGSSSAPRLKSSTSYGGLLPPTKIDPTDAGRLRHFAAVAVCHRSVSPRAVRNRAAA